MAVSIVGYFYIVQPLPEVQPGRIKLGFTTNPDGRLASYRGICPEAKMLRKWRCWGDWERPAIDYIATGCKPIGQEVFTDCDVNALLERASKFFTRQPSIPEHIAVGANGPKPKEPGEGAGNVG